MDVSAQHARILASLIEKAETTPDHYPLTSKALQAACNQATNRDPVVDFSEREVDALMLELRQEGLARTVSGTGHRVGKHKHIVDDVLGLDGEELAVLAVLLLRGAQTLNQITTRTDRYARGPAGDTDAVSAAIDRLAARPEPLVVRIGRQPGEREPRIAQCWAETGENHESGEAHQTVENIANGEAHQTVENQVTGGASIAREFWKRIETLHAVTYFDHESTDAATNAGLRGFWMGYFGFRAAPLGGQPRPGRGGFRQLRAVDGAQITPRRLGVRSARRARCCPRRSRCGDVASTVPGHRIRRVTRERSTVRRDRDVRLGRPTDVRRESRRRPHRRPGRPALAALHHASRTSG